MIRLLAYFASVAALWAGAATAQEAAKPDVAKGQNVASQVCAPCHAADGNSTAAANPKLAGQFYGYLHKQIANFKAQGSKKAERENPVMAGMVTNLSDADMRNVAAYFASQKLKPAAAKSKELAAAGQKLYRAGNAASGVPAGAGCHGPSGAGIPSEFPRIAGQFPEYTESQLKAFRSGSRANDPASMMRTVAGRMTDQEIQAVADYVAGLR
jgi:cytochrome c553